MSKTHFWAEEEGEIFTTLKRIEHKSNRQAKTFNIMNDNKTHTLVYSEYNFLIKLKKNHSMKTYIVSLKSERNKNVVGVD